jgi:hypothetical protein
MHDLGGSVEAATCPGGMGHGATVCVHVLVRVGGWEAAGNGWWTAGNGQRVATGGGQQPAGVGSDGGSCLCLQK